MVSTQLVNSVDSHPYHRGDLFQAVVRLERLLSVAGVPITHQRTRREHVKSHRKLWRPLLEAHLHIWAADNELSLSKDQVPLVHAAVRALLRRLRVSGELSLTQLIKEMDVPLNHATLSQIERGHCGLTFDRLLSLDTALNRTGVTRTRGDVFAMVAALIQGTATLPDGSQDQQVQVLVDTLLSPSREPETDRLLDPKV